MNRAQMRGKKLDEHCKKAETESYNNNVYCLGLIDDSTLGFIQECRECKANLMYESEGKA